MLMFRTIDDLKNWLRAEKERSEKDKAKAKTPSDRYHAAGVSYGLGMALDAVEGLVPHEPKKTEPVGTVEDLP